MNEYIIYLGDTPIARVSGTEYAFVVWVKVRELAELLGREAAMAIVDDDWVDEEVAYYDPEEEED